MVVSSSAIGSVRFPHCFAISLVVCHGFSRAVEVNDNSVENVRHDDVVSMMRGGNRVVLRIARANAPDVSFLAEGEVSA